MEELKELIKIVSKVKVQQIEIIGNGASNKSAKSQALYEGIASGQFETDEIAALAIYGPDYKKDTYRKLKKHLENKLLNTLFFIDVSDEGEPKFLSNYIHACKLLATVMVIHSTSLIEEKYKLTQKLLKIGLKFGFSDIIIKASTLLKSSANTHLKNYKQIIYYDKILKKYHKIKGYEILAHDAEVYLTKHLFNKTILTKEVLKEINKKSKQLQRIIKNYHSAELLGLASTVIISNYQLNQQYEKQLQEGFKFLNFLEKNPNYKRPFLLKLIFLSNLETSITLKKFIVGKEMKTLYLKSFKKESYNGYYALELYIILCMHTQRWTEAYEFYHTNVDPKFLRKLDTQKEERFNIIHAFLYLLFITKKIKSSFPKKQFRLHKFLNEVPHYSQDKRGINIPILIVQILILLAQNKKTAIIDKQDALQQYAWRYLRNDQTLRSNCFIKMLGCMTKTNFHKNASIRTAKKYYDKLVANPARNYLNAHFIEIIPYEDQWEMVLELLENKAR